MANPWDNDPIVGSVNPPASAPAAQTAPQAPSAGPAPWENDPIVGKADVRPPAAPTHPVEAPSGSTLSDAGNFLRTAAIHAAAGLGGIPNALGQGAQWLQSKGVNDPYVDLAAVNANYAPSTGQIEDTAFNHLGAEYQPQTTAGKYAMAGVSAALPALATDGVGLATGGTTAGGLAANLARSTAAGVASQGAQDMGLPAWLGPAATFLAELAGRTAISGARVAADGAKPLWNPKQSGEDAAATDLRPVDNSIPALASPSSADEAAALADTADASGQPGPGDRWAAAGAKLRAGPAAAVDAVKVARAAGSDADYEAFRAQQPIPVSTLAPFMSSPSFRAAVKAANGAVLDEGGNPLTDYWEFNEAGDPISLKNAAVPPDVLDRIQGHLSEATGDLRPGTRAYRTASTLAGRFGDFLTEQYPATDTYPGYASIRQNFADASRPLDPAQQGAMKKMLATNRQFGQETPVVPDEGVPDLLLNSPTPERDFANFKALGGDTKPLEDALVGEMHRAGAIDPITGEVNQTKMVQLVNQNKDVIAEQLPGLEDKLLNARQAQTWLDGVRAQRAIAADVANRGLRDDNGMITGRSFGRWLDNNADAVTKLQPGAMMRLKQIQQALPLRGAPGETAEALISEGVPATVGGLLAGPEGVITSLMPHKLFGAWGAKQFDAMREAYNSAIERAVTDPAYANDIGAAISSKPAWMSSKGAFLKHIFSETPTSARVNAVAGAATSTRR